ncbi:MAG: AAA family ATPase [Phycisphaerae bacterium]|nr:AAA family ATPase [Phycisphaerae bacterium]
MHISRVVVRNFRNLATIDVSLRKGVTCIIGENNIGKTNLLHALRLVLDGDLPGYARQLTLADVNEPAAAEHPFHVVVAVEFSDFEDDVDASAFAAFFKIRENLARLTYRFRPNPTARDALEAEEREAEDLTIDDYRWEITGGGNEDPSNIDWHEDFGRTIRISDLNDYLVVFLHALRDVVADLRSSRQSPLRRIIRSLKLPRDEQARLVEVLSDANTEIASTDTIKRIGELLDERLSATAGEAFKLSVALGMGSPTFSAIERALTLLLSSDSHSRFEPGQNGLGLNNVLYVALLLQYFESRLEADECAGAVILFEEPESHLHPQLQRVLLETLKAHSVQVIVTTHSTHVTAATDIDDYVVLSLGPHGVVNAHVPRLANHLSRADRADLNRYLDATKSTLLFARRVILVEGPAELFLVPTIAKHVCGIDLDRHGVAVVPIFGTYFAPFAKLFGPDGVRKRCAIVTDRDDDPAEEGEAPRNLGKYENEFVKVFACDTTLERELAIAGISEPLRLTAAELRTRRLRQALDTDPVDFNALGKRILKAAELRSKGRFAQVLSKHMQAATDAPEYLKDAIAWVTE